MLWAEIIETALSYSEALAVVAVGVYIGFETRFGAIKEVRTNQRILGVTVYRIVEMDANLDEKAFRDALWGDEGSDEVLISDLDRGD